MKPIAKFICCSIALGWLQGAVAADVAVSEQNGSIVLEMGAAPPDVVQPASAPVGASDIAPPAQAQPGPDAAPATRVPVKAYYETVDRANIEKRMDDRAARIKKRKADAEKDAAERAAKAQMNQTTQQGQGAQNQ